MYNISQKMLPIPFCFDALNDVYRSAVLPFSTACCFVLFRFAVFGLFQTLNNSPGQISLSIVLLVFLVAGPTGTDSELSNFFSYQLPDDCRRS